MVGIVKWKSRIWEDDYNQITGNFEMVLANEDGQIKYSQEDSPVIYDVSKLASFKKINENFTQGAYLVCKHKQFNDTTLSWSWSLEGCLINHEDNNRVTCQCTHLTRFRVEMVPEHILKKPTWTSLKALNAERLENSIKSFTDQKPEDKIVKIDIR